MSGRSDSPETIRNGGRLLGFGLSGTRLTEEERNVLYEVAPAAIVLFSRNVESEVQLDDLVGEIRESTDPPPVLLIDQEGGPVDRLRGLVPGIPGAADFVAFKDPELTLAFGRAIGSLLARFDIEVNLAPVVDLWRNGLSPSLVRRCFGSTPDVVAERAGSFIRGMAEQGVLSCLKHFPGLGVAETDPHHATSVVDLTLEELERADLAPYRLIGEMAPSVMVSHEVYPKIDPSGLPGTLSSFISTTLLRDLLGYEGLAVTDDMEMHAVSSVADAEEIAERSVLAGNDLVLFCRRIEQAAAIASRLAIMSVSDDHARRMSEARARVQTFVRQCQNYAGRRAAARGGLQDVRDEVADLNDRLHSA